MASSNAERQRRYRAHKAGRHDLCLDPARCAGEDTAVTPSRNADNATLPDLGTRGRRLWQQITAEDGRPLQPAELVLLEDACRVADRLDRLHAIERGDATEWMSFRVDESGTEVTVVVNSILAESRQQALALRQLLAELRTSRTEAAGKPRRGQGGQARTSGTGAGTAGKGGGKVVALSSRVASRRRPSAG